jgi:hypothetical protein
MTGAAAQTGSTQQTGGAGQQTGGGQHTGSGQQTGWGLPQRFSSQPAETGPVLRKVVNVTTRVHRIAW